jgi:hypothetical protein
MYNMQHFLTCAHPNPDEKLRLSLLGRTGQKFLKKNFDRLVKIG